MKLKRLKKILLFISIAFVIVIILILIYNFSMKVGGYRYLYKVSNNLIIEKTYDKVINEVNVDSYLTDIYINKTDNETFKVVLYGDEDYINLEEKNNKLYIDVKKKKCIGLCIKNYISKVEIYLPSFYSELVEIKNKYGNITIENLIDSNFNINSSYGDILITDGNFVTIKNKYGNIKLDKVDKTKIVSTTSNIDINEISNANIVNDHGDVTIKRINKYLNLYNDFGDVIINDLYLLENSFISNRLGNISIKQTNEIYIDAEIKLGSMKINNKYEKENTVLKIINSNGNINISN